MRSIQNFAKVLEREFPAYVAVVFFQAGVRREFESYWREGAKWTWGRGGKRKGRTPQITQTRLVKFSREKLLRHSSVKNNCCREMCRVNDRKYGIEFMPLYFCVLNSYSKQYDGSFDLRMNCLRRRKSQNLPGPISIFLNVFFRRLNSDARHGTWPMF